MQSLWIPFNSSNTRRLTGSAEALINYPKRQAMLDLLQFKMTWRSHKPNRLWWTIDRYLSFFCSSSNQEVVSFTLIHQITIRVFMDLTINSESKQSSPNWGFQPSPNTHKNLHIWTQESLVWSLTFQSAITLRIPSLDFKQPIYPAVTPWMSFNHLRI